MRERNIQEKKTTAFHIQDLLPAGGEILLMSDHQVWSDLQVMVCRLPPLYDLWECATDSDVLTLNLHSPTRARRCTEGHKDRDTTLPGSFCLEPKLEKRWYAWDSPVTSSMLYLEPSLLQRTIVEVSSVDPLRVALRSTFNFHDPFLQQVILALHSELETGSLWGQPYIEALGHVLVLHLLRHYASMSLQSPTPVGCLSQQQIREIRDYIYDHLSQGVSLNDMATSLGLSVSYFTRLFKEATRLSPHQYVIQCRIDRAKHLLRDPSLTIAEVAQRVGFTDQSHLHRHFKRSLGITPGDLRDERTKE